jgi:hypothetical protein
MLFRAGSKGGVLHGLKIAQPNDGGQWESAMKRRSKAKI